MSRAVARSVSAALLCALGASCAWLPPPDGGIGRAVDWSRLPGWAEDRHAEAWPALLASCSRLDEREPGWGALCAEARSMHDPSHEAARAFFERHFEPHRVYARRFKRTGLVTGYYEPMLEGSLVPTGRYRHPVYGVPEDLVTVRLGDLYPEFAGKHVRGRLAGREVIPYLSRAEIERGTPLSGNELVWVDDALDLFFLQIQGSGRVRLPDGRVLGLGYADQNGHPYVPIGRVLIEAGEITREEMSMPALRDWLTTHPDEAPAVLEANPSYVFFRLTEEPRRGPVGSLNVPLTPRRSIAVDRRVIPLGVPLWLETSLPGDDTPWRRLVFAHDTGGAIRGKVRADVFWGHGEEAERRAGLMKHPGRLTVLIPRTRAPAR